MTTQNEKKSESNLLPWMIAFLEEEVRKATANQDTLVPMLKGRQLEYDKSYARLGVAEKTRNERNILNLYHRTANMQLWSYSNDFITAQMLLLLAKELEGIRNRSEQKSVLSEEDAKKLIDAQIAKRFDQLYGKGGQGYIA